MATVSSIATIAKPGNAGKARIATTEADRTAARSSPAPFWLRFHPALVAGDMGGCRSSRRSPLGSRPGMLRLWQIRPHRSPPTRKARSPARSSQELSIEILRKFQLSRCGRWILRFRESRARRGSYSIVGPPQPQKSSDTPVAHPGCRRSWRCHRGASRLRYRAQDHDRCSANSLPSARQSVGRPEAHDPLARTFDKASDWRLMFFEWALANDVDPRPSPMLSSYARQAICRRERCRPAPHRTAGGRRRVRRCEVAQP